MGNAADYSIVFLFWNLGLCILERLKEKSNLQNDSLKSHLGVSSKCHILVCSEVCKMKRNFKKQEIDCKASDGANGVSPILKALPALILSCKYSLQNESFQQLSFLSGIL